MNLIFWTVVLILLTFVLFLLTFVLIFLTPFFHNSLNSPKNMCSLMPKEHKKLP